MNDKISEHYKMKEEYLFEAYKDKSELPKRIRIDASSKCQLNCKQCYMRLDPQGVENGCKLGNLKFSDYKKFIDENDIEYIEFSNHGEMFLNPEFEQIIKYSYEKNIIMGAGNGVNLNFLPAGMAEILVKYKFDNIVVSIDGATQETYAEYRVNGDLNKVLKNIEEINYYKKLYKSDKPYLTWKFIVFGHNEHEIELAKKLAKKYNMAMEFTQNVMPDYSPVKNKQKVIKETGMTTTELPPHLLLEQYENKESIWFYCAYLWEEPQINWDGKVLGCCSLYNDDFGGNIFKDGYLQALNHPKYIYAKNMLTNNAPPAKDIPCTDCCVYKDFQEYNHYMKSLKKK